MDCGVFCFDQLALEFHGGGEFLVLCGQLGIEEKELLDLFNPGERCGSTRVDLVLNQLLYFGRTGQAGVVAEGHVAILREFFDIVPGRS
jgi:hypothetical protein